ncbi:hypothetical protein FCG40_01745 [Fimbriimonadia bacterium ATM]|nr:MAG: hypothetical protein EDM73_09740 [Armatimonadota bacterium]MBC6970672.1 hypothetical protein [Armatimonadota bacterium]MCE7899617.1 hypothetical protein [Armatimonadetes bacterium ATM1]MDL1927702.1 hypothetical protein [Fimbriimonadia bacterium ATM]RIJ95394.1 MAG: hypothetical protein DCC45_10625 [Armatimonadota bacterium]
MLRRSLSAFAFIACYLLSAQPAHAQETKDQRTKPPAVEKWTKNLRSGLRYSFIVQRAPFPLMAHVLHLKFPQEGIRMESLVGGDTVLAANGGPSRETVSSIAARTKAYAAINGDYFGTDGDILGFHIFDGELVSEPFPTRAICVWNEREVRFDKPSWSADLVSPTGQSHHIDGVNRALGGSEIIVVTPRGGKAVSKNPAYFFVFESSQSLRASGETPLLFKHVLTDQTEYPLKAGQLVVMANERTAGPLLENLQQNTEWKVISKLEGGADYTNAKWAVAGGPTLLSSGRQVVAVGAERFQQDFVNSRHPRTGIGITPDGEILFVVVDGRSSLSAGLSLSEFASLFRELGCTDAINLDGGGSSTLYVAGSVLNRPSDGTERRVGNALLLFLPELPSAITDFKVVTSSPTVAVGGNVTLVLTRADGTVVPNESVLWICEGRNAWIDQAGLLRGIAPGKVSIRAVTESGESRLELEVVKSN